MQTICKTCHVDAVSFNEFNVSVSCTACGVEEPDIDVRQRHLQDYLRKQYIDFCGWGFRGGLVEFPKMKMVSDYHGVYEIDPLVDSYIRQH